MAMRCRICAARGVDGPAMPGEQPRIAAAMDDDLEEGEEGTGLTQAAAGMAVHDRRPLPPVPAELPAGLLQALIEESISKYSELVSAVRATAAGPGPTLTSSRIDSWPALHELLLHLAYLPEAACPWRRLGFAPLEGPEPTLQDMDARFRTARLLCSASQSPTWSLADRSQAAAALQAFADGVRQCTDRLPEIVKVRRQQRAPDLPLWRELGASALGILRATAPTAAEVVLTQWSTLKLSAEAAAAARPGTLAVDACRRAAALAAKGDDRIWSELGGRPAVLWAPTDSSALGRLLRSYMKRTVASGGPPYIRLLVPMDLFPGCHTVAAIQDLRWHPLLGERWVGAVKKLEYDVTPYSTVLPGAHGPRHELRGLAIFTLAPDLIRTPPSVLPGATPMFQVTAAPTYTLDFPAEALPQVLRILADPSMQLVRASAPHRSVLSTAAAKRMSMEWAFPPGTPELQVELLWRHLRRSSLPANAFFGSVGLHSDATALICELTEASAALHAWELSVSMVALKENKLLLRTDADPDVWKPRMTTLLQQDPEAAILGLKWRPSRGGRPWALPGVTPDELAAARRTRGGRVGMASPVSNVTDVQVCGSPGYDALGVYRQPMAHMEQATGIHLREATSDAPAGCGYWRWLAASDPVAPPGRLRLHLSSEAEVTAVREALHGKTIQVGLDRIALQVTSDAQDLPGNGRRRRGAWQPASAGH
ncbi:unnamed protein product [Prorocentrum cordatum]|uniref:Uncharacterized protein n=1 Tax=Prorocentrum cordatum TaxID=2364126 RepID=A0ABN9VZ75_9DINO|nr:unnamed protein product [Polarella glacialis]